MLYTVECLVFGLSKEKTPKEAGLLLRIDIPNHDLSVPNRDQVFQIKYPLSISFRDRQWLKPPLMQNKIKSKSGYTVVVKMLCPFSPTPYLVVAVIRRFVSCQRGKSKRKKD